MWIRSQKRYNLVNTVEVYTNGCSVCGIISSSSVTYSTLGEYKSEERVFEVIDEIMMAIVCNVSVYEMPNE
jgi:hypothetical protein